MYMWDIKAPDGWEDILSKVLFAYEKRDECIGYCLELCDDILDIFPRGKILSVEPEDVSDLMGVYHIPTKKWWFYHSAILLDGYVIDPWYNQIVTLENYLNNVYKPSQKLLVEIIPNENISELEEFIWYKGQKEQV